MYRGTKGTSVIDIHTLELDMENWHISSMTDFGIGQTAIQSPFDYEEYSYT